MNARVSKRSARGSRVRGSRRVLLDALTALAPHGAAFIVAGAQAVYLHTGDADLAVAPYTTDGDLALNPRLLRGEPKLEEAMSGCWVPPVDGRWPRGAGRLGCSASVEGTRGPSRSI